MSNDTKAIIPVDNQTNIVKKIDKDEIGKLFVEFEGADKEWNDLKAQTDAAYRKRSDVIQAIAKAIAPKKELMYKGQRITIVIRNTNGRDTYFFRGAKKGDVLEIE